MKQMPCELQEQQLGDFRIFFGDFADRSVDNADYAVPKPSRRARVRSITSSAPPPIDNRRASRKKPAVQVSSMYPMPPWNCRHQSAISRCRRPALSLAMVAERL